MPQFMDVHTGMVGVTPDQLLEAHRADLAIQDDESVDFKQAWADPKSGHVFCLSDTDARRSGASTSAAVIRRTRCTRSR